MASPTSVIAKNNQAAAALEHGRLREAMRLMRSATTKLNELYQQGETEMVDEMKVSSSPLRSTAVGPCQGRTTTDPDEDCSTMYRRAILLSREDDSMYVVASVVLYNLALCEHTLGTELNSPKRIASALKFYKRSYQIIEEHKEVCLFDDLLVLAVINNIADCSAQIFEGKKSSKRWFDFLGRILEVANSDGSSAQAVEDDDYMFFYLNAILHQWNMLPAAAAA